MEAAGYECLMAGRMGTRAANSPTSRPQRRSGSSSRPSASQRACGRRSSHRARPLTSPRACCRTNARLVEQTLGQKVREENRMLTKRTRGALLLAAAAAVAVSFVAASANAGVAATAPTKAQCVKQARAATSAVKKRFTIPSYPTFRMKANAGKNVWYIAPSLGTGYALALSQGVKAAAETAGLELTVWDSRGLASEMGAGLDRAIADKADMIVIHSINPTVVTNQLKEAAAAKIPVLSILNALDPKALPTGITATLDPDAPKLGALLMDFALSTSKCQLNTGWFYAPSFPIMQQMTKGLMAERARLCPSCPSRTWQSISPPWPPSSGGDGELPALEPQGQLRHRSLRHRRHLYDPGHPDFRGARSRSSAQTATHRTSTFSAAEVPRSPTSPTRRPSSWAGTSSTRSDGSSRGRRPPSIGRSPCRRSTTRTSARTTRWPASSRRSSATTAPTRRCGGCDRH